MPIRISSCGALVRQYRNRSVNASTFIALSEVIWVQSILGVWKKMAYMGRF